MIFNKKPYIKSIHHLASISGGFTSLQVLNHDGIPSALAVGIDKPYSLDLLEGTTSHAPTTLVNISLIMIVYLIYTKIYDFLSSN